MPMKKKKTIVGDVHPEVLSFTVGKDPVLDLCLVDADCIGSAAHVTMLSRLPLRPPLFTEKTRKQVISALVDVMRRGRKGTFKITARDQDVHLAVERQLTASLGDLGKKIHTARSRNDQVAVDLRLFGKVELLDICSDAVSLMQALLKLARRHRMVPMVGRTHLQPAMPGSVGLWASAHAESLMDDLHLVKAAYEVNDRCPLGSAAGYGVPLGIDRELTSRLLGFSEPVQNVLYASCARGKCESAILSALAQVMLTLSRLAEDMILYSMPEFRYFRLPAEHCTGSSIMPQKKNPDVLELVRAKTARVLSDAMAAATVLKGAPSGYNRDLQEIKEPYMEGLRTTGQCLRVMALIVDGLEVDRKAMKRAFTAEVFATDRALELVADGKPFRDAYDQVRSDLGSLQAVDPAGAIAKRTHLGAGAGLDLDTLVSRARASGRWTRGEQSRYARTVSKLLGVSYPELV